jgi:hypothetical protein
LTSSRSAVGGISSNKDVKVASIAMTDRAGKTINFTMDQIRKSNLSSSCEGVASDIADLLRLDKSMTLICDKDFVASIPAAIKITITTDENQQREFTSWGNSWSEMGGTILTVYSFSI